MRKLIFRLVLVAILLSACSESKPPPIPTRADPGVVAETLGVPPQYIIDRTSTARAPNRASSTPTNTFTPVATQTPSNTPTSTPTPTRTLNPIKATETAIQQLTFIAETLNAPTATSTPTSTSTATPTITYTPSNTPFPTPILPDNPTPNAIVYTSNRGGTNDIWLMALRGEPSRPLLIEPTSDEELATCNPSGENTIMFVSDRDGDREIYLTNYLTGDPRPLTDTVGENFQPIWSPQGDTVAFVSTRSGNADIWLMDNGGGNPRSITSALGDDLYPSWSGDGNVLFYSSNRDGNFEIYQFNLDTLQESRITYTDNVDELYPTLAPDFVTLAYIAESTPGDPNSTTIYIIDSNQLVRPIIATTGRIATPQWISQTSLLVSAELRGIVHILLIDLEANRTTIMTRVGPSNTWPRYCYLEPLLLQQLPSDQPTAIFVEGFPTPGLAITSTPQAVQTYQAVPTPGDDWIFSQETWSGEEFAWLASQQPNPRAFIFENLVNLVWNEGVDVHVLSVALEAVAGDLTATTVGYTINDFPGPGQDVIGQDTIIRQLILRNSIRPGPYYVDEVSFTDVNITISFRVPIQAPDTNVTYTPSVPGEQWLISAERWTTQELAQLAGVDEVFIIGEQMQFNWQDQQGQSHVLLVEPQVTENDLELNVISYNIDDTTGLEIAAEIRQRLLFNSIAPGPFTITRVAFSDDVMELLFLVPPQPEDSIP